MPDCTITASSWYPHDICTAISPLHATIMAYGRLRFVYRMSERNTGYHWNYWEARYIGEKVVAFRLITVERFFKSTAFRSCPPYPAHPRPRQEASNYG